MPTKEELQAEAAATGVPYNTLLAQHYKAGTLDVGLGEAQPVTEAPPETLVMEPGPTPRERAEAEIRRRNVHGGGFWGDQSPESGGEIVPQFRSPQEQQAGIPPYHAGQTEPVTAVGDLPPGEGAFEMPPTELPPMIGGVQLPKTNIPGLGKLQKAIDAVPKAYKEAEEGLTAAAQKERGAIGEWEKTEQEAARAKAAVLASQQKEFETSQAENIQREEERQAYIDGEMGKLRGSIEQMKASKIDPYRFYRHPDGSTDYPKSIAAVIAVGLGALGSSLPASMGGTGGPNRALAILDRSIDRDLAAQRDDIANQRAGVGLQMNLLSQMRGQFSDERQAENAARIVMLETFKMKLEETAAKSGDKRVQAQAANLYAQADQKEAQLVGNMQIASAKEHVLGEKTMFGARTQQAGLKMAQQAAQQKAMATKGGKQLPASAVTKMADFRAAGGILGKVKETWNKEMKGTLAGGLAKHAPWATESKKYNDKVRAAAQFVGKKLEGRMTDEDYDRILAMFPSPGDSDERAQAKFQALEDYLGSMEEATLGTFGETGFDVSGFSKSQVEPTAGFRMK